MTNGTPDYKLGELTRAVEDLTKVVDDLSNRLRMVEIRMAGVAAIVSLIVTGAIHVFGG